MAEQKKNMELNGWIEECRKGNRRAQHQLYKHFYSPMYRLCMRYANTTDEADDMLNEGFLKVFSNLAKYENSGSFESWMRRVMTNAALDYRRKYGLKMDITAIEDVPENILISSDENQAVSKLSADELILLIQQLPPASRTVFNLYVFEDYSHAEIAKQLHISEGTSAWHLNFARSRLKDKIMKLYNEK